MKTISEHHKVAFALESLLTVMLKSKSPSWNEIDGWIVLLQNCQEELNRLSREDYGKEE